MAHPNLARLPGRDPEATFPVHTFAEVCPDHEDCIVIRHHEQRDLAAPYVQAWESHAHRSGHVACRIGDATPECDNATGTGPDVYQWQPMCADCHELFGHARPYHHTGGEAGNVVRVQLVDGRLMIHRDHPRFADFETHPGLEVHSGASFESCERCGPQAAACDGCRAGFEAV